VIASSSKWSSRSINFHLRVERSRHSRWCGIHHYLLQQHGRISDRGRKQVEPRSRSPSSNFFGALTCRSGWRDSIPRLPGSLCSGSLSSEFGVYHPADLPDPSKQFGRQLCREDRFDNRSSFGRLEIGFDLARDSSLNAEILDHSPGIFRGEIAQMTEGKAAGRHYCLFLHWQFPPNRWLMSLFLFGS